MQQGKKVLIMGAAGRDFHNFNVCFRDNPDYEVVAFTATQIPDIEGRKYPADLSGKRYPKGVPIYAESELTSLIKKHNIDEVFFAYSDVSHNYVMNKGCEVMAAGANFRMIGYNDSTLKSKKTVVSVCAVRTGCGKSQTTRKVCKDLQSLGKKVVAIRHPMPYGNLSKQKVQRFETMEDMKKNHCTIEEMEEYEGHIQNGIIVYAGIDYEAILRKAEKEADVIVWDGGNNDMPFYKSDLEIVVVDPHRPGHETTYYPGEINFLRANIIVINKMDSAETVNVNRIKKAIQKFNPTAKVLEANSAISVDKPEKVKGKKVLVVEDGPTLTHGNMKYGAGSVASVRNGASDFVDPRPFAVGSIQQTFRDYPHIGILLPAMGYSKQQIKDLEETINKSDADVVVIGTPIDLSRIIKINKETVRVSYQLEERNVTIKELLKPVL